MPKSSWKDIMATAVKELVKPKIIESEDSDTDLDRIPDNFEDTAADQEFLLDDDMTKEFPELNEDELDWKAVNMRGKDVLIRCLFQHTPNQRFFSFTWIKVHGLCVPMQWQFKCEQCDQLAKAEKQHEKLSKAEKSTRQTDGVNDSSSQDDPKMVK